MLDYNNLNENEKRTLRNDLGIERISTYYLEDHNVLLMEAKELFDYIYLYDIKKVKDAVKLIERIVKTEIASEDVGKSVINKILESDGKVIKLSDNHYAYKES